MGEIKSSAAGVKAGSKQVAEQAAFFEWAIRRMRPDIKVFTKLGHVFIRGDRDGAQSEAQGDMVILVHRV